MKPLLSFEDVGRTYAGPAPVVALSDIDLEINRGDFLAIEGPSGGGKSTLLNLIGLLDIPTKGHYRIEGVEAGSMSARRIAELRSETFSFIFQGFHLLDRRNAIDSVELGMLYRGLPPEVRQQRALEAMRQVGIEGLAWTNAGKLSGGERQRVAIARALASGAPVVVADEPTGNLDSENSKGVIASLRDLNSRGATVVLVTHSPEIAAEIPRRISLRDGRIIAASGSERQVAVPEPPRPPGHPSRIRLRDVLTDAWSNVMSRPSRTSGLTAAVAVAVGLAIISAGIGASARAQVSGTFDAHSNRDVSAQWSDAAVIDEIAEDPQALERLKNLSGVSSTGLIASHGGFELVASSARPALDVSGFGITGDAITASRIAVNWAAGHPHELRENEVIVGMTLSTQLQLAPTDRLPGILIGGKPFVVSGLISDSPLMPELLGGFAVREADVPPGAHTDFVRAVVSTDPGAAQQVAKQAPIALDPYHPDAMQVSAPIDPRTLREEIESDVAGTLVAFTALAVVAAIAGLGNAMMMAVIERRHEFGLRRAIGARARHIFWLVVSESAIIGLAGGFVGLVAGIVVILGTTIARNWTPVFDLRLGPLAVLGGVLVGVLGGLVAARRATRIQPSEALRQ